MQLEGIAAYAPEQVWSNARVAARLRLERIRLTRRRRAAGEPPPESEEAKLFQSSDRWVRRFIGFTERRFTPEDQGTVDLAGGAARLLLESGGHDPAGIDALMVASVTTVVPLQPARLRHAPEHARHSGVVGAGAARDQGPPTSHSPAAAGSPR
jgi:3-oxoacyl-[acyl-carrier-protein] synthase III